MSIRTYLAGGLLVLILCLGWATDHYYSKAAEWRDTAHKYSELAKQQAATLTDINKRQQQLAVLDKTHTEALNAAETENDTLRRQLADGTRRMYVSAKCPAPRAGTKAPASGVGNGTRVELTGNTRQNILDIRAGIIRDREKLKYLQEYIRQQCLP